MTYETRNRASSDTLQLQSVGHVVGQPAANIKAGNTLMWNFGEKEKVLSIVKETPSFISISIESKSGHKAERRLKKDRLVCILKTA